jgi:hypothetical protein
MHTLGIYFDLQHPAQQTPGLSIYLNNFQSLVQAGDRLWFVLTDDTPDQVRAAMTGLPFMAQGFTAVIWSVGTTRAYHGYDQAADNWLSNNWVS